MARAPTFSLRQEDLPNVEGMDKLIRALGAFAGQVQFAFSNAISFEENINSQIAEIDVSLKSDTIILSPVPPWTAVEFMGAASYHTPPVIRKSSDGFVIAHGAVAGGTAGTIALQVPLSFAPAKRIIGLSHAKFFDNETSYRWEVFPTGEVRLGSGVKNSLPCSFFNLHACWLAADAVPATNEAFPLRIRLDLKENASPLGILILKATEFLSSKHERNVGKPLFVDWTVQSGYLVINDIPGLTPGRRYKLKLLIMGK